MLILFIWCFSKFKYINLTKSTLHFKNTILFTFMESFRKFFTNNNAQPAFQHFHCGLLPPKISGPIKFIRLNRGEQLPICQQLKQDIIKSAAARSVAEPSCGLSGLWGRGGGVHSAFVRSRMGPPQTRVHEWRGADPDHGEIPCMFLRYGRSKE